VEAARRCASGGLDVPAAKCEGVQGRSGRSHFKAADTLARSFFLQLHERRPEAAAAELSATLKACTATVTRKVAGPLKLEEWRFPGDVVIIDVSLSSSEQSAALELFRNRIANHCSLRASCPCRKARPTSVAAANRSAERTQLP
jgi:hypothetical protein